MVTWGHPREPLGESVPDLFEVSTLALPNQMFDGELPPEVEVQAARSSATELAHTTGAPVNLRRVPEE